MSVGRNACEQLKEIVRRLLERPLNMVFTGDILAA